MEALEAFFTANQLFARRDPESFESAIEYYEHAIELDPEFAGAYAGLAGAWLDRQRLFGSTDLTQVRAIAATALQKSIELDPDSPDALAALGWHDLLYEYDWKGAEQSFRRALRVEPTNTNALHWYSHLLTFRGLHEDSIKLAEIMVTVDPLSIAFQMHLSNIYGYAGRWDEAISLGEEVLRRDPSLQLAMSILWHADLRAHRAEEAVAMLKVWATTAGHSLDDAQELGNAFIHYQQTGEPPDLTDELLERLQLHDDPTVFAAVGDGEKTIEALQKLIMRQTAVDTVLSMNITPTYDFIRDDPRFVELLEQIGLAD
jgi:tetratricopeptide (TPR) repeat protein